MTRAPRARDEDTAGDEDATAGELDDDDDVDDEDHDLDEEEEDDDDGTPAPRGRGARTSPAATSPMEASEQIALIARFALLIALPVAFWIAGSFAVGVIAFLVLAGVMAGTLAPEGASPAS